MTGLAAAPPAVRPRGDAAIEEQSIMFDPDNHLAMWKFETAERERRLARGLRPGLLLTDVLTLLTARWRDRRRGAAPAARHGAAARKRNGAACDAH